MSEQDRKISGSIQVRGEITTVFPENLIDEYKCSNDSTDIREEKRFRLEKLMLWAVMIGTGLGLIQTFFVIRSANAARDAAVAAKQQSVTAQQEFELSERPWIATTAVPTEPIQIVQGQPIVFVGIGTDNVGHSVARDIRYRATYLPNGEDDGKECALDPSDTNNRLDDTRDGYVLFPGQSAQDNVFAEPYKKTALAAIDKLILVTCVYYKYPFDKTEHFTQSRYWVNKHPDSMVVDSFTPIPHGSEAN